MSETSASGERSRKRIRLACQACQKKRTKCDGASPACGPCIQAQLSCNYVASGLKRGPPKGYKPGESSRRASRDSGAREQTAETASTVVQDDKIRISDDDRDYLLSVYFTHVHNVWPIIYKPMFNPSQTHPVLLSAMLATASVVAVPNPPRSINTEMLFNHARQLLQRHRDESRMYVVQALFLLAIRQTGKGNKSSAYLYAGQACAMALEMGLHRTSTGTKRASHAEEESRSRVFWCCFVIDKAYAEETGKPAILPSRRSTIPLPSVTEADEYEFWPPPSTHTPRHTNPGVQPAQSRIISAFNATCQLGLIVERILDLEAEGPRLGRHITVRPIGGNVNVTGDRSEMDIAQRNMDHALRERHPLARELSEWYAALPDELRIDVDASKIPLTHLVVNLAWYHSATILLHSRFIGTKSDPSGQTGLYGESHMICTASAESIVALLACLDRFQLLSQVRSDIIHMLSLAVLFHAYNSSLPDVSLANSAKLNFSQCCLWLRDISQSWAPASAHRLFFEGLIQGGLEMSADTGGFTPLGSGSTGKALTSSTPPDSPTIQLNGSTGRVFALASQSGTVLPSASASSSHWSPGIDPALGRTDPSDGTPATASTAVERQPPWPNDLLQLPTLFWNDALGNIVPDDPFSTFMQEQPAPLASSSANPLDYFGRSSDSMVPPSEMSRETTQTTAEAEAYNSMVAYMLEAVGKQARGTG